MIFENMEVIGLNVDCQNAQFQYVFKKNQNWIFQEALDNLQLKIVEAKKQWYNNTTTIHGKAKQVLLEFGLNPLYI